MYNHLYIHIPWCHSKCSYCAFSSRPLRQHELQQTTTLLKQELELTATALPPTQPLESIYFGGGTPSLLKPKQVAELLETVKNCFSIADNCEITLEANPGAVTAESLARYRQTGVNRLSIGGQSFSDRFLKLLGRQHRAEETSQAVQLARWAGFSNLGLDLICGLPQQTADDWQQELETALRLQTEHLSIYSLTVEDGTPFADRYPDGKRLPDDDTVASMLEQADQQLTAAGFEHYEIANFARPGYRSRHNSGYWQRDGYLGIGPAAHSLLQQGYGVRFQNPDRFEDWENSINSGILPHLGLQRLNRKEGMSEHIFLGLRLADGVLLDDFERLFDERLELLYAEQLARLQQGGLITCKGGRIALTTKGMLLSNQVFTIFL